NFAKFVTWPPDTGRAADAPFVIGVAGDDAFARALEQAVKNKSVDGHPFEVRRAQRPDDLARCQVAYLASTDTDRLDAFIRTIGGGPVLTIGQSPEFARRGGIINFFMRDNQMRFEINPEAASRAGLQISSKLLQLATIVGKVAKTEEER